MAARAAGSNALRNSSQRRLNSQIQSFKKGFQHGHDPQFVWFSVWQRSQCGRENTEAGAQRGAELQTGAIGQFAAEFMIERKGWFDRFIDGLNRLPRPLMVFSVLSLFALAMFSRVWFGIRMQGLALVPEPLWWLMGVIVSFYFGARAQTQHEAARQTMAQTMAQVPQVIENIEHLRELDADSPGAATTGEARN
uniref:holin family protein n=1 Tax=Cochlodiniinecator piscidefendens TaxID=2715756 RepID=UPI001E555655|nr:holin family protein [Cochlodiniinecator piscidefendens]